MTPIIQPEALIPLLDNDDLVLVDAGNGKAAGDNYNQKHLQGALFADLNTRLADIGEDASNGGRHPLPGTKKFSQTLTSLGISPESHVVIYDDKNGSNAAARFWWMLRAIGHEKVQVLNGGLQEAEKAGVPTRSGTESAQNTGVYPVEKWQWPIADIGEVEAASGNKDFRIIDVRDQERYLGITEPLDPVAGHIPGAINMPFRDNLDANGRFKAPEILKTMYQQVFDNRTPGNVIVHCGSGVTACHTILAMDYAGLPVPKLYPGSWSEWCRSGKDMEKN
ncbi:sulfurtransferase [Sinomicrobium sp. M5D2P9]